MNDPVLDYRQPEPPPKFRWRNIPKLLLIVLGIYAVLISGALILDHYTGWIMYFDH